jgi:hypothetical protein
MTMFFFVEYVDFVYLTFIMLELCALSCVRVLCVTNTSPRVINIMYQM